MIVYIVMKVRKSWIDDQPTPVIACFDSKEKAEKCAEKLIADNKEFDYWVEEMEVQ